jgi:phosphatidylglycerophosphate synthase
MILNLYDIFILFIFLIKIIYFILAIFALWYQEKNKVKYDKLEFWKNNVEFIFTILICILIIIIFNPFINNLHLLNRETNILLVAYALITIYTAQWETFIKKSFIYNILFPS